MKRTFVCLAAMGAVGMAWFAAQADVVAWWRFDTVGADGKVVNAANPGTYDGYLTSGSAPSNGVWPADAANMPVVTNSFAEAVPRLIDQKTGAVTNSGKALLWDGPSVLGGMVVPYEDAKGLLDLEKFTIEAFVRLPPEAASRANQMFPILHFGNDSGTGFMFSIWDNSMSKGYLFFRATGSGWEIWKQHAAHMPGLYDGRWHHVAVAFNGDLSTQKATLYLYVDGVKYARHSNVDWKDGWDRVRDRQLPLTIGRHLYQDARTFMGEIAEVRISDEVLTDNQFLVPLADRPALTDDDTALMLTFDAAKTTGYGFAAQHLALCIYNSATTYVWSAKNWNIQNAATRAPLVPRWFPVDASLGKADYLDDALRPLPDDGTLPGAGLYGGAYGTAADAEGASIQFSRNNGAWADLVNVPGASALATNDVTVELFFKTDIGETSSDTDTLVYGGFIKWCVYQGKLLARTFTKAGQNSGNGHVNITSPGKVNDGQWHHAAYVYDKANGTVSHYLDYVRIDTVATVPYVSDVPFLIGGETRVNQTFEGNIDDVRITRRALKPCEFLTTHAAGTDRAMDAPLESDWSTGADAAIAPAGVPGTLSASATSGAAVLPTIVKTREGLVTLDGEAGAETRESGHAARLDGGYVKWPCNRLLDRSDLTAEFFARFDTLVPGANLLRLSYGTEVYGTPVWVLFYNTSRHLQLTAYTSTNGWVNVNRRDGSFTTAVGDEADGKWHHWALTVTPDAAHTNTTFTLYRDYEQLGDAVTVEGLVRHTTTGSNLSVGGTGVAGAFIHGLVNNMRISPGVLPPSEFMRFIPKAGTSIFIR